jgi:hypothetical protein
MLFCFKYMIFDKIIFKEQELSIIKAYTKYSIEKKS